MPFGNSTPRRKGIEWRAPLESRKDSVLATLGFDPESRWDSDCEYPKGIGVSPERNFCHFSAWCGMVGGEVPIHEAPDH